jgi:hypothetical protein
MRSELMERIVWAALAGIVYGAVVAAIVLAFGL